MICHLNYTIEKSYYKKYFFDNYDKGDWHRRGDKVLKIWWKMFDIDEVVNLVESPNVFLGQFDKKYLKLPREVLTTSMIKNQKYFPLLYKDNTLSNFFIIVSNLKPSDNGKKIIYGNQRVIEARLEDASFFWIKDNN